MDDLETLLTAQRAFGERVRAVRDDQWQTATPASEWNVAALVGHLVEEHLWAPALLRGHDLDAAAKIVDGSRSRPEGGTDGGNLAAAWDEASAESADAFSADGALERSVTLSRGDTPARDYLRELNFDLVVHAWDLERAIDFPDALPDVLVATAYEQSQEYGDMSSGGMFDAPVPMPDDATTLDKLVAQTGREPG